MVSIQVKMPVHQLEAFGSAQSPEVGNEHVSEDILFRCLNGTETLAAVRHGDHLVDEMVHHGKVQFVTEDPFFAAAFQPGV